METLPHLFLSLLASLATAQYKITKAEWSPYTCPPNPKSTLPSPTYHNSTPIFTTCSSQIIHAPLQKVYNAILDFSSYPLWNTFVRNVTLLSGPPSTCLSNPVLGTELDFTTYGLAPFNISTSSREIISYLLPPSATAADDVDGDDGGFAFLSWKYNDQVNGYFVRAEHPSVLTEVEVDLGQGKGKGKGVGTRYVSWESYYGSGSYVVGGLLEGNLRRQFVRQGEDLKGYVESLA